jgi:hypothetical protein
MSDRILTDDELNALLLGMKQKFNDASAGFFPAAMIAGTRLKSASCSVAGLIWYPSTSP